MQKIYEKALWKARKKVFEDSKYESVILFCKEKLADYWYARANILWEKQNAFATL